MLSRKGPAIGEALASRYDSPRAPAPPPPTAQGVMDETDAAIMRHAQQEISHNLSIHSDLFAQPTPVAYSAPKVPTVRKLSELIS